MFIRACLLVLELHIFPHLGSFFMITINTKGVYVLIQDVLGVGDDVKVKVSELHYYSVIKLLFIHPFNKNLFFFSFSPSPSFFLGFYFIIIAANMYNFWSIYYKNKLS